MEQTNEAQQIINESELLNKKAYCPKCKKLLIKSKIKGYAYQCLKCDEDFYNLEVIQ